MWNNSGNWNMWAMQPAAYSNIPSDQVDWASLAKQWIANREMLGVPQPVTAAAPPPPLLPPVKPMPPMGRLGDMPAVVSGNMMAQTQPQTIVCDMENSNSQDSNYFQAGGESEQGTSEGWNNWNQNMPAWAVPPPPPPVEESQNFTRGNAAGPEMPPYGGNAGQYMTSSFSFNQSNEEMYSGPYEHAGFQQFWGQGPMAPHQVVPDKAFGPVHDTMEYRAPPKRGNRNWPPINDVPPLLDESGLDAAKRRHLPLWIREGLEKMEREKQRQMEKEQLELAMQNAKKAREEAENDNMEGKVEITGPIKSIFDSDDEEKHSDVYDAHQSPPHSEPQKHVVAEQKKSPLSEDEEEEEEDAPVSDEERQARMMLKVRQMLTEVLLEVTNREIDDVAHSVYSHAKRKQALAPARQLAKSTALASITSLGLGYGSESSEDEADNQASSDNAEDSDDEEALQARIRRKKAEFEQKMREAEEKEKTKEMEILKHAEEQTKSQKHTKTSGDPSYAAKVENEDDGRTGQESETARTRSKADHGSKTECLDEKKQFGEEVSRTKVAANKQTNKSKKVEVEESSESESDSNSDNSSSSESDSSESSSSETSESAKGIKNVTKKQPKSQASLPDEGPRDKERGQNKRRNEEEMRAVWQESSSSRSRKEADWKKHETKEEERRLSKKKRLRNSSDGEGEGLGQGEKRRHVSQSDDNKYSRHRLEEPRTMSRQTERTEDKDRDRSRRHKDSSQNHKKFSQKQDDWAKSDDSDRRDASYDDYLSRTCEQDYERSAKSRHKRSKRSQSSHSSTERPSRRRRDKTPDRRQSTHGQFSSSSGKDQNRHKSASNRSGKKERAKHRSRSRSRSES